MAINLPKCLSRIKLKTRVLVCACAVVERNKEDKVSRKNEALAKLEEMETFHTSDKIH